MGSRLIIVSQEYREVNEADSTILSIAKEERSMLSEYGGGVYHYVFNPDNAIVRGVIELNAREALRN